MGHPKALLQFAGKTFLEHVLNAIGNSSIEQSVVVAGHHRVEIADAFPDVPLVFNPDYEQGMTTQEKIPRPRLADSLAFEKTGTNQTINFITGVDSRHLWDDFAGKLDYYQSTHVVNLSPCLLTHP